MKQPHSPFPQLPKSVPQFLAYQLARHLEDDAQVSNYMNLTTRFSVAFLLEAYRNAAAGTSTIRDRRQLFWQIIERSTINE